MWWLWLAWFACAPTVPDAAPAPADAPQAPAARTAPLDVRALSFPAAWLAERVGGSHVHVTTVIPEGEDPPFWQPPPELVAALADADLIVANGAGYEKWTLTATLPTHGYVDLSHGLDLITLPGITHSHGKAGSHTHAGTDPHTWSDPTLFLAEARTLRDALSAADPASKDDYAAHTEALARDLEALDARMATALAPAKGLKLSSSHPAFNYLARRYGLDLTFFTFDPEEPLDEAARAPFDAWAATAGPAPLLLWEATPTGAVVASLPPSVRNVVIDPLEQPGPDGYDYLRQATVNAEVFQRLFAPDDTPAE